jgi:hypothetical protein
MQLNITRVHPNDMSYKYYCVTKNELKTIRGELQIQGKLLIIISTIIQGDSEISLKKTGN